jgi:hypothetical protein
MMANNTGKMLYDDERLSADLVVLPDIYRVGMSGSFPSADSASDLEPAFFPYILQCYNARRE